MAFTDATHHPAQGATTMNADLKSRLTRIAQATRRAFSRITTYGPGTWSATTRVASARRGPLVVLGVAVALGATLVAFPPVQQVPPGAVAVRSNNFDGDAAVFASGPVWIMPGMHSLRYFALRERTYRPQQSRLARGAAPFQSAEGLSIGVDLVVRWTLDPGQLARIARTLPDDVDEQIVQPAVNAVAFKILAQHNVKAIFSTRRAEIQQAIANELKVKLIADGVLLRGVHIGAVDLPGEYRAGMDRLLAEELAAEKMRHTLELREKAVRESELLAQAEKARRLTQAAAAAQEQIIAARAQEEAMRHVLPFKTQQIQQRQLEAEAEKVARIKAAEGAAQARRIEAAGEADSRRKLAEAEVDRLERIGQVTSAQMARDGALLSRHPLLIQKTMADKLSDKIQVIIAPPGAGSGFVAAGLIGGAGNAQPAAATTVRAAVAAVEEQQ
jgi:regulator of protease activity HflC (stomatin/prohibitin superfamily)